MTRPRVPAMRKRGAIFEAARTAFAERGYDGVSLRGIAVAAGVDPALVLYYYASKAELYRAIVDRRYSFVRDLAAAATCEARVAAARAERALRGRTGAADIVTLRCLLRSAGSREAAPITRGVLRRLVTELEAGRAAEPVAGTRGAGLPARASGTEPWAVDALSQILSRVLVRDILGAAPPDERPGAPL